MALIVGGLLAAAALVVGVVVFSGGGGGGFPDEEEEQLLSLVPPSIQQGCGQTLDVVATALTGIDCRAQRQHVSYYRFGDTAAVRREHARRANLALPASFRSDAGTCAGPPRIGERVYSASGRRVGRVFCAPSPATALIGWTDERTNVFAIATRADGDEAALYRWWERAAGPLRSASGQSPEPRSAAVRSGVVLYGESFSSSASGWSRPDTQEARYAYAGGRYRIVVKQPNAVIPVTTANLDPPLVFGDVRVEATVARAGKQRSYGFGLVCRSGRGALYTLQIRSDRLALIRKRRRGKAPIELATPASVPRGVLKAGANRIAATCVGGGNGPVRLTLSLNGRRVLAAEDRSSALASTGAVGVFASSLDRGGVVVAFDNFRVRKA